MASCRKTGRLAGLLWALSAITGGFSLLFFRSSIIVPTDAAATARNIAALEPKYRAAIVGSLVSDVLLFFLALTFFHLFRVTRRRLATVLLASNLIATAVGLANTLNHFAALIVLSHPGFLREFSPRQLEAMALLFLRLANGPGQGLLEIFWAPYFISLGLLIIRSRVTPRIFGIMLTLMGTAFAVNILQKFLLPELYPEAITRMTMTLGALGSIPTMFWLLIKGANEPKAAPPGSGPDR
jgi:hypothetical protein